MPVPIWVFPLRSQGGCPNLPRVGVTRLPDPTLGSLHPFLRFLLPPPFAPPRCLRYHLSAFDSATSEPLDGAFDSATSEPPDNQMIPIARLTQQKLSRISARLTQQPLSRHKHPVNLLHGRRSTTVPQNWWSSAPRWHCP